MFLNKTCAQLRVLKGLGVMTVFVDTRRFNVFPRARVTNLKIGLYKCFANRAKIFFLYYFL